MQPARKPRESRLNGYNENLVAIDVHTHAEVSSRVSDDPLWRAMQEASARVLQQGRSPGQPSARSLRITARERWPASYFRSIWNPTTGIPRVSNEEVAETAAANADVLDPLRQH